MMRDARGGVGGRQQARLSSQVTAGAFYLFLSGELKLIHSNNFDINLMLYFILYQRFNQIQKLRTH